MSEIPTPAEEGAPAEEVAPAEQETPAEGAVPAVAAWNPPPTLADRLSPKIRRVFKVAAGSLLVVGLGAQALWAIPTHIVSQRPGFQALRKSVEADRGYRQALWGPVEADAWPETYSLPEDPQDLERYTLLARGPGGVIRIEGHVQEGKVVHMRSRGVADWPSAWRARKQTQ